MSAQWALSRTRRVAVGGLPKSRRGVIGIPRQTDCSFGPPQTLQMRVAPMSGISPPPLPMQPLREADQRGTNGPTATYRESLLAFIGCVSCAFLPTFRSSNFAHIYCMSRDVIRITHSCLPSSSRANIIASHRALALSSPTCHEIQHALYQEAWGSPRKIRQAGRQGLRGCDACVLYTKGPWLAHHRPT